LSTVLAFVGGFFGSNRAPAHVTIERDEHSIIKANVFSYEKLSEIRREDYFAPNAECYK